MAAYALRVAEWAVLVALALMLVAAIWAFATAPGPITAIMALALAGTLAFRAFAWKGGQ